MATDLPISPQRQAREKPDLAVAVRDKALAGLAAGRLAVTTRDGLAAQALLDRREEHQKDREFMLNLARLLSGGGTKAPEHLIEGEYTEVAPDQRLLAPPELRETRD